MTREELITFQYTKKDPVLKNTCIESQKIKITVNPFGAWGNLILNLHWPQNNQETWLLFVCDSASLIYFIPMLSNLFLLSLQVVQILDILILSTDLTISTNYAGQFKILQYF